MMLRIGILAAVFIFTAASGWNNWEHLQRYGYGVAALVIAAEILKVCIPVALIRHAENRASGQWLASLAIWLLIILFSFVNTFGAGVMRIAKEKGTVQSLRATSVRAEHVIAADMAKIRTCDDKTVVKEQIVPAHRNQPARIVKVNERVPDTACQQAAAQERAALEAEMVESRKRRGEGRDVNVSEHTTTDGYLELLGMLGWRIKRHELDVLMVLLWTLLCEVGSGFGGLAVPRWEPRKKQ